MTRAAGLVAINCTACGAGLDVLGGGRVQVHICPYCGTELDAHDGYKALGKFANLDRPASPFSIGMTGTVQGVAFTVIGTLGMEERWGGRTWSWVEHQVYSPTHGYAFLSVEDGHVTFTRKVRGVRWLSSAEVERAESRPNRYLGGVSHHYYETSTARVVFAEGEFSWRPKAEDAATSVSCLGPHSMISFEASNTEREVFKTVYLTPEEVRAGFPGAEPEPRGSHPLKPFDAFRQGRFLIAAGLGLGLLCVILAVAMASVPARQALEPQVIALSQLPAEVTFDLERTDRLAQITLRGDVDNSWAFVEAELAGPDGEAVFEAGRTVEYYSGFEDGEAWSEGSRSTRVRFFPPDTGTYTLTLSVSESGFWVEAPRQRAPVTRLEASVVEGLATVRWLIFLAIGFALVAAVPLMRRLHHASRRWSGSDWTDED